MKIVFASLFVLACACSSASAYPATAERCMLSKRNLKTGIVIDLEEASRAVAQNVIRDLSDHRWRYFIRYCRSGPAR